MACLSCCVYMTKNLSNSNSNGSSSSSSSPSSLPTQQNKPRIPAQNLTPRRRPPPQPSVIEIERAIGAGRFRDADPRELEEEKNTKFDMKMLDFPGKFEQPIQKKIRESAERITEQSERTFRSNGKKILMFTFVWLLPIWTFSLLVASGIIKLPFTNQLLDQLIM
ncbi:probable NAD(P)H dehydrogenase subunit CRR3, chloroplastic [Humulus lupulus]|uniref:probable NAD(P)H dehydrogenase subunit CRR3, chloroplastic n=1 Tax=Humulus lupulus TaxID=3486 RepID=UPI002B40CB78|nr:probable NAD(P)H dehydrogenase subunit CRR3, chloroplastic [Humulus lupulus]